MVAGKGFHKFCECYYKGMSIEASLAEGYKEIDKVPDKDIEYGKTGSREKIMSTYSQIVNFYLAEQPEVGEILGVEASIVTDFKTQDGTPQCPIKAVTDLVTMINGDLILWDYKSVSRFTDKSPKLVEGRGMTNTENYSYILQAMFNYHTCKHKYGQEPKEMRFVEVKNSKNKDGSPQLDYYVIEFDKSPQYFKFMDLMIVSAVDFLTGRTGEPVFLPSLDDQLNGTESVADFINEVIDVKTVRIVDHKKVNQRAVTQREYETSLTDKEEAKNLEPIERIAVKFMEFGCPVEAAETHTGANVVLYTFKPARGVPMSKYEIQDKNIMQALAAESVRIIAPVPGTDKIGVEVGRKDQQKVEWTKELLTPSSLVIPVGVDVYGKSVTLDLTKAPHLLVAGATGAGKSVFLNTLITTLTQQNSPHEMDLLLIDPKRTEFFPYSGLPHVEAVAFEPEDIVNFLHATVKEMERRYDLLQSMGVRDISEFNKKAFMKWKVIVIDELADLILGDQREFVEHSIKRLTAMARAAGIHLVLATQRPSVDVVTGVLKANLPTRVAFMVSTRTDSQVILDEVGAEQLIGNGDLLLSTPRVKGLQRLQGYFI